MIRPFTVTLYTKDTPRLFSRVDAQVRDGCLQISGQDLGGEVEAFWGEDEYEYFYMFTKAETERFFTLIGAAEENPEQRLVDLFSGKNACRELRALCDKNGISYRFDSC